MEIKLMKFRYCKYAGFVVLMAVISGTLSTSCVTMRDVEYFQGHDTLTTVFQSAGPNEYLLKPGDELMVHIASLEESSFGVFSGNARLSGYPGNGTVPERSVFSCRIDRQGEVQMPVTGKFTAAGRSLQAVGESIRESLENILNQPVVTVDLMNRYVTIIGEVRNPGQYPYTQSNFTLLDAIGQAGDLTDYGDRQKIILTRNIEGENRLVTMDLTNPQILSSSYFYVQPNDVIYVKPSKKKFWSLQQMPYSVMLSTLTTALFIFSVLK